jgi:hypothetical protein
MPGSVWAAFFAVSVVGGIAGLLAGAELVSGLALVVLVFMALAIFVVWTVMMLDPQALAEESEYQGKGKARAEDRRRLG